MAATVIGSAVASILLWQWISPALSQDGVFSAYCSMFGKEYPGGNCPNAELMVTYPILLIIGLIYLAYWIFIAAIPVIAGLAFVIFIWNYKR